MRTTREIQAEITKIRAADKRYNQVVNEGGEGYERDSVSDALRAEYLAAEQAEFAATWTAEITAARRAAWNAGVAKLTAEHGNSVMGHHVRALADSLGYTLADIKRAKALHGL